MKRRIFTLLAVACVSAFAMAQAPNVDVTKTTATIVLDGVADAAYDAVTASPVDLVIDGTAPTINSASWKALWNDNGIYVVVTVSDDVFYTAYSVDPAASDNWNYDKPEIYFDVLTPLADGVGASAGVAAGHSQFAPTFVKDGDGAEQTDGDTGRKYGHKVTGNDYVFEYFVPFSYLEQGNASLDKTAPIGFDVTVIDRDAADDAGRLRRTWSNPSTDGKESWANMDLCGTITLVAGTAVKSVTASKASAYVSNGALVLRNVSNVSLYDVTGKLVAANVNNGASLSALKTGVYVVKANNFTAKIIK